MPCLDELSVLALVEGRSTPAAREAAEQHIDACADCRGLLAAVARTDVGTDEDPRDTNFAPGELVGRYLVLTRVGAGGMGEVYAAWDPELDRKVALKVVSGARASDEKAQRDLVREAKASASINHPNVITVYDVGDLDGRLYLAMEFMDGGTLTAWMAGAPRPSWRRILAHFLAAGEGLAAAHRAGLIHRDFKPDNVLLGADDRVCVTDFGLARALLPTEPSTMPDAATDRARTRAAGTPAYMAPEQLRCEAITVRADQFGFCVAVWEGLYGVRPFGGDSIEALLAAAEAGTPRDGARGGDIPKAVRRALLRGLSADAERRHASLPALIDALRRGTSPRRASAWIGVASIGILGLGAWAVAEDRARACPDGRATWDDGWSANDRTELRDEFIATGAADAIPTYDRFERRMNAYVDAWSVAHREACLDAQHDGDERAATAKTLCLERHRAQALHLLEVLRSPDRRRVRMALAEAIRLPRVVECEEPVAGAPLLDDAVVSALELDLDRAQRLDRVGRAEEAAALLEDAERRARERNETGIASKIVIYRGFRTAQRGEPERGRDLVVDGGLEAIAADRPDLAASAFANLVHMDGLLRGEEFSRHWGDLAEAMLARLGTTTQYHTSLASARAYMTLQSGQIEDAVAAHEHVLELAEATLGPDNHHTLGTREALAHLLSSIGENERALPLAEGTLARQRELFGETSRDVATSLGTVANVLTAMLRGYEAVPYHERSIAIMRELYGDADLEVGNALTHFAATLLHIDQPRRALEVLEEARPIARELSGRGPTHAAYVERLTGDALAALGELEQARDIWLAALAEPNTRIPPPMRIMLEVHLANALRRLGDPKAALDHAQAAGQVAAETYGTDHFLTALGEVEQTMASVANGAEDLAPLERLAQDDAGEYAPRARFYLAQALMARGRDTDRAYALAVQAHVEALRVEPLLAREIAAWQPTR